MNEDKLAGEGRDIAGRERPFAAAALVGVVVGLAILNTLRGKR